MAIDELVCTERYPVDRPEDPRTRDAVQRARAGLDADGCAVLPGLLRPEALRQVDRATLRSRAHYNQIVTNPYSSSGDSTLPETHPVNTFLERSNAFVAKADIAATDPLRRLYHHAGFRAFVAECLGEDAIYEYDDPFAGFVYNVLRPGGQHPWHYDTNEFIVSTLVDPAEDGGLFEYCPRIRTPESERFADVEAALAGRAQGKVLELRPGDLQLFHGRYSLHRVTRNQGTTPRITAIFAYARMPGIVGSVERTRRLFGRVAPEHLAAAEQTPRRADALRD